MTEKEMIIFDAMLKIAVMEVFEQKCQLGSKERK